MWLQVFVPTKQQHTKLDSFNYLISIFRQSGQIVRLFGTKSLQPRCPLWNNLDMSVLREHKVQRLWGWSQSQTNGWHHGGLGLGAYYVCSVCVCVDALEWYKVSCGNGQRVLENTVSNKILQFSSTKSCYSWGSFMSYGYRIYALNWTLIEYK